MPDTEPQYGLPYQQLPGTQRDLTPESVIRKQIQTGRKQIYDKYNLQWKEAYRGARFIGKAKTARMQQEIHAKFKQEILQFDQEAKQQMTQLQDIDRLAQQGMIPNPDEIKARMTFGTDVAKSMYPTPAKERTIPQQFGELDVYSHRISQELERFQIIGGKAPSKLLRGLKAVSPLATAISAFRGPPKGRKGKLQIWDPTIPVKVKDPKTGKLIDEMGKWRKAEPGEIGIYQAWLQEEKDVAARKRELLGQPDISRRRIQPGTISGTFDDKIAESVRPRQAPTVAKPKVIRQRNTRTGQERISYDGGRSWQIVSG